MNSKNASTVHYPALDGVRGAAITGVVLFHDFAFTGLFSKAWVGVDLFFVLSGFLITDILLRTRDHKNFLTNFYARRILRIFPLYYLALIIFLILLPRLGVPLNVDYYIRNQTWLWTYTQNWLYAFKDPDTNTLNHLWSLAVEEQFYLVWPLIILLVRNHRKLLITVISLFLALIIARYWVWEQAFDLIYFNLFHFTRFDSILVGCMVALLWHIDKTFLRKKAIWIILAFAFLNTLAYFINRQQEFPYMAVMGYPTIAVFFGLLVNEVILERGRLLNYVFTLRVLKFLGKISYGLYVFHWPVYLLLVPVLMKWIPANPDSWWIEPAISITATLIAILVSWISYRFYESYFLRLKDRFS